MNSKLLFLLLKHIINALIEIAEYVTHEDEYDRRNLVDRGSISDAQACLDRLIKEKE